MDKITEKIKLFRTEKGYNYEYMAFEMKISTTSYRKIETNQTKLTVERLYQIATILDKTVMEVLDISPKNEYKQVVKGNATGVSHQELKDNAIAHVENLYQDNKEKSEKIEFLYQKRLEDKDFIIVEQSKKIKELETRLKS